MANRELVIVFVYDTLKCTKEEDNPDDAVLFFHPGWVSEQQRISLCGQLMGTSFFISSTFSQPRILSLQSGKFAIRYFGRYIMAMGTDRNIPEWVLEQRADLMTALLKLYFKDMDSLAASCVGAGQKTDTESFPETFDISSNEDSWEEFRYKSNPATLPEKLSRIFETFMPIVQYTGQIFANVPIVRLPKSAINVYLEGIRILRCCQELKGVLGGTLLYQNKVVASQLSSSLTKQLVITDPYRIKSPGEHIPTTFPLPSGVQLLKIYISSKYLRNLRKKARNIRSTFPKAEAASKLNGVKSHRDSQPEIHVKQNRTHIFTVPEEDDSESDTGRNSFVDLIERRSKPPNNLPIVATPEQVEKVLEEVILEPAPLPVSSKGTNLVCSTPARDVNVLKLLTAKAVSICNNVDNDPVVVSEEGCYSSNRVDVVGDKIKECAVIPDVVRDAVEARKAARRSRSDVTFRDGISNHTDYTSALPLKENKIEFLSREPIKMGLSTSLDRLHNNSVTVVSLRYYSLGLPGLPVHRKGAPAKETPERSPSPAEVTLRSGSRRSKRGKPGRNFYHTITDPCFPIFWDNGVALSRSLFDQYLSQHYQILGSDDQASEVRPTPSAAKPVQPKEVEAKPSRRRPSELPVIPVANPAPVPSKPALPPAPSIPAVPNQDAPKESLPSRRPLSLALNTVMETQVGDSSNNQPECRRKRVASQALPSVARPTSLSGGLALTPLMARLSHLAMDRHGTTGLAVEEVPKVEIKETTYHQRVETPITPRPPPSLPRRSESKERPESLAEEESDDMSSEDVVLFVCGMQSMTLLLVVEKSAATSEEVVHSLREITSNTLEALELLLHRSMDNFPSSNDGAEIYSYMCLDPQWGATQKGGVWSTSDLELVGSLHKDFNKTRTLTEVCFRSLESLVYGYQCGGSQVFYQQQTTHSGPGLPTPADIMGTVPLRARRCLERDHGIILL